MKRRDFIKTLPVIAAAPLTLVPTEAKPKSKQRHLIALGTTASRLVARLGEQLNFDSFTVIDNKMPENCKVVTEFISYTPPGDFYEQIGERKFDKRQALPLIPPPAEIINHLHSLEGELVFYATLGSVVGTILFQSIGAFYTNRKQHAEWLAVMPFEFEGSHRRQRAKVAIAVIADQRKEPTCLDVEHIREKYGNISVRSAFDRSDEWVLQRLKS
jgi:hypothetical protein